MRSQDLESPEGRRIAIVFLSTALELLLEDGLRELLKAHTESTRLSDFLFRKVRGRDNRIDLHETLAGRKLTTIMAKAGHTSFHNDWENLAKVRNEIAHGRYLYDRSSFKRSMIFSLQQNCLRVFATIQNFARTGKPTVPQT